ncbi:MAG: glycoside hydrolase family 5 protein [Clostridiales bacterium]|nr:glycoside hydrolase family 5 protein [Clostridiales bacterium]
MDSIGIRGAKFVDQFGRQRIFHGVNLVFKGARRADGSMDYDAPHTPRDIDFLAGQGFNVVRYGLIWDAVEPRPGVYDDEYLDRAAAMLDACAAAGLHVFLDMHQDLYSARFGDGAPGWATLTDQPFESTALWSDAYLTSPAVQQAYDAFWANRLAEDGVGLQDHYAAMWAHVARRLGGHPAVIGYDFLNEPNPGSGSVETFGALMAAAAALRSQAEGRAYAPEEMAALFADPQQKLSLLSMLEDKDFYRALGELARPAVAAFERGALADFYNRMTRAVRGVGAAGIVFRENSYFSNMGIPCDAPPILGPAGREPLQAYSPHGYDLVVDTEALALASDNRADVIFEAHRAAQRALDAPVLVGEWGAFGHEPAVVGHARHLMDLFDGWQWSNTYWCYHERFDAVPALSVLRRAYPRAVAGEILSMRTDEGGNFTLTWRDDAGCGAPTEIHLHAAPRAVELDGAHAIEGSLLRIPPAGGERTVKIRFKPEGAAQ